MINKYITDNRIIINKSEKTVINEGTKFLIKHSLIARKDEYYIGLKNDLIADYAGIIKIKESVKIDIN